MLRREGTLSQLTPDAIAKAAELKITLVDGPALLRRIERVRAAEPCPDCGTPMLLGHSYRGWWLRCPRCPGKRDLDREPWRALELLVVD